MPELAEENSALLVYGIDDGLPSFDLLPRPDSRGIWVPDPRVDSITNWKENNAVSESFSNRSCLQDRSMRMP